MAWRYVCYRRFNDQLVQGAIPDSMGILRVVEPSIIDQVEGIIAALTCLERKSYLAVIFRVSSSLYRII